MDLGLNLGMSLKKLYGLDDHVRKVHIARASELLFVFAVVLTEPFIHLVGLFEPILQNGDLLVVAGNLLLVVIGISLTQKSYAVIVIVDLEVLIKADKLAVAP